jgi:glyoxylase-like metal-dependent hydrolase (beta-lactamase superfamily II)
MGAYHKQEQEPATDEVTEVAPGVLRLQLPIALPGLGHVNCYALEDERGVTLMDPGLPGESHFADLVSRLGAAGFPLARVHTVVVPPSHPDHFGGAARLRHETGAEIVTHESFQLWFDPASPDGEEPEAAAEVGLEEADGSIVRPTPWGGEYRMSQDSIREMRMNMRSAFGIPRPTVRLADAQVIRLGRRDWVAVHTPGHTPDHLCLLDPDAGTFFSGDDVLPTITPHISGLGQADDPLAEFFASLQRVADLHGVTAVLPAHGHPFHDLAGRVEHIRVHHEERLEKLAVASESIGRMASVHELMQHLFSERAWGSMAESETYAHLQHLHRLGRADTTWDGGNLCFQVA